jgi:hypothetical protein
MPSGIRGQTGDLSYNQIISNVAGRIQQCLIPRIFRQQRRQSLRLPFQYAIFLLQPQHFLLQTAPGLEDITQPIPCVQWREHQAGGESDTVNGTPLNRIHTRIITENEQHQEASDTQ